MIASEFRYTVGLTTPNTLSGSEVWTVVPDEWVTGVNTFKIDIGDVDVPIGTVAVQEILFPENVQYNKTAFTQKPVPSEVWLTETHTEDAAAKTLSVTYTLHANVNTWTEGLFVNIAYSDTGTGDLTTTAWELPTGTLTYSQTVVYNLDQMPADKVLEASIQPGLRYTLSTNETNLNKVTVVVADVITVVAAVGTYIKDGVDSTKNFSTASLYEMKKTGAVGYNRKILLGLPVDATAQDVTLTLNVVNHANIAADTINVYQIGQFNANTVTWDTIDLSAATTPLASKAHGPVDGATLNITLPSVTSTNGMVYLMVWSTSNASTTQIQVSPVGSANAPKLTLGSVVAPPDPYVDSVIASDYVLGDMSGNDVPNWNTIKTQLTTTGKKRVYFAENLRCRMDTQFTMDLPDIEIWGGGEFCINYPDNYNPPDTSPDNTYTILNWTGANPKFDIALNGQFDNTNINQWWRGRKGGNNGGILARFSGNNLHCKKIVVRNSGGYGFQCTSLNSVWDEITGSNNGYLTGEWKGNAGAGSLQSIHIKKHRDKKDSLSEESAVKSLVFTTANDLTAKINYVRIDDAVTENCIIQCEGGPFVGSSDSTPLIETFDFGVIYSDMRHREWEGGTNSAVTISNVGKWENVGDVIGDKFTAFHTLDVGQSFWWQAAKRVNIKHFITNANNARCAVETTHFGIYEFIAKSATQNMNFSGFLRTTGQGQKVTIDEIRFNTNGTGFTMTSSAGIFDFINNTSTTTCTVGKLTKIGTGTVNLGRNDDIVPFITLLSGNLAGFSKGPSMVVKNASGINL